MTKLIVIPVFVTTALLAVTVTGREVQPFMDLSFDHALELAGTQDKIIMAKFYADWCHLCRKMDKETFTDPDVQEALTLFIPIRVDVDQRQGFKLAQDVGVVSLPTIVFFDPSGKVVGKYVGFHSPDTLKRILEKHRVSTGVEG
ncbi:MAG: thioredoxin fold domain-containing protein [Candidatus Marinimicrobia bacterium]|nr:thioredoxin fold domain-containing protein [Candidatus Neomarinimicrobiota bacterium]